MRQVADQARREPLLTALLALLTEEAMVTIVERLLAEEDILAELELPYLRRIRNEGRAEGRREGEAEVLLRQLQLRFGPLPEDVTTRVTTAEVAMLLLWSERY